MGLPFLSSGHLLPSQLPAEMAERFRLHFQAQHTPVPFSGPDTTCGVENEFQVAVAGNPDDVDLAITLKNSQAYKTLRARAARGDLNPKLLRELDTFLKGEDEPIWENSWVRFPCSRLSPYAMAVLNRDLLADKNNPQGPVRSDRSDFLFTKKGEPWLRIPISYLLKLALADITATWQCAEPRLLKPLRATAEQLMTHFISDNSSPEITSFTISSGSDGTLPGRNTAKETSRRFLFLQLLIAYANRSFGLTEAGQTFHMYMAPNPPFRQKQLNDLIPDQFYRELFLNPCLSGWQRGEVKKEYMGLCHRTLSRSQLNTIAKLKEAGIIINNLVVLPNTSSTSLANNGTHITLGSRVLSQAFQGETGMVAEKYFGDLVIKIVEHFLPLFVTTCSAAPYRLGFSDFHPEKVLGYLPHELDYTHLRMLWRRWKKKADLKFCGHRFTPVGPLWLDQLTSAALGLHGDYLPDIRLIDYLIALHSVDNSPALSGVPGNQEQLKQDLTEMGIFDSRMAIYLPYRMRAQADYGFSGFEGRHYSLFPDLGESFARAVDLQALVTSMSYRWVLEGTITHGDIPDDPQTESERRQIFFAAAIGLPTVFIKADTKNRMLRRILALVEKKRPSHRYRGYLRIKIKAYQKACLELLRQEEGSRGHSRGVPELLATMHAILGGSQPSAARSLTAAILARQGGAMDPMHIPSETFNRSAEAYYRNDLCRLHLQNGLDTLMEDARQLDASPDPELAQIKQQLIGSSSATLFLRETGCRLLAGEATDKDLHSLALLTLLILHQQQGRSLRTT